MQKYWFYLFGQKKGETLNLRSCLILKCDYHDGFIYISASTPIKYLL